MSWLWIVPGDPVGKGRPRFRGVPKMGRTGTAYTPKRTAEWEASAAWLLRSAWGDKAPLTGAARLDVTAVYLRPVRMLKATTPDGRLWRTGKPDGDNVLKIVGDALKKAGVVRDDSQVVSWHCDQVYSAVNEGASVEIRLREVDALDGVGAGE